MLALVLTESLGSCAFFCSFVGQFKTNLFVSVQAEDENMIWVMKKKADQKIGHTLWHFNVSSFSCIIQYCLPFVCHLAPKVTSYQIGSWHIIVGTQIQGTQVQGILDSVNEVYIT